METDPDSEPADGPYYHVDGEVVPVDEATVSVRDRGFLYGDAAFETVRAYGGTLFRWDAHVDRLFGTCETLGMPAESTGLSALGLRARVRETLEANGFADARVRVSVTRGPDGAGAGVETGGNGGTAWDGGSVTPPATANTDPTVVVTAAPLARGGRDGDPPWDGPATLQTAKTRRVPDRSVPTDAKTHSYLAAVLARAETRVTDADEAVLLDADGVVTGCAAANLFFVADDALRTPPTGTAFPGVARATALDIAREEGFPVETGRYAPDDVRAADEAFVTSTVGEIRPVGTYDGVEVGGGPVTALLSRLYDERVERACYADGTGAAGDDATEE
ncbi:aminotransferase class IV [Candidatus Halobonum tyrrellensis]|uniref:Aminodeoxychorismate lyase n=1 Tax=Candidatus Halobonum tyrrellensis G22 TaxID=1324957 RepID=V4HJI6_9EURY|nr:aminotransferase class IV [Candidatus Halobonum tyrrellensis]ESP89918.1 aminodeoxychorismate lyase [Candidatus Halobonum tyrrellensis G22]